MSNDKINYEQEVKKVYPTAKCYNTGTILGGALKCYHIGVKANNEINIIVPSHYFKGNAKESWKVAYEHLKNQNKI